MEISEGELKNIIVAGQKLITERIQLRLSEGKSIQEIADELQVSLEAVIFHLPNSNRVNQ
jgi:orotate phosphoribosyltransferase-like protein